MTLPSQPKRPLRLATLAALSALGLAGLSVAGTSMAQEPLPSAPSAVLAAQKDTQPEAHALPAGSGFVFTAPATLRGPGGSVIEQPTAGPLRLSLDDAISLGLERNIRLKYDRQNQLEVRGFTDSVLNVLIPNLNFNAQSTAQELDLAAMGFKPSLLSKFSGLGLFPAGTVVPLIVKVNTTQASLSLNQVLFNAPDIELYRGTKSESAIVDLTRLNDRGDVVVTVGRLYLKILADQSNVTNALAQERSAETLLGQATARQNAGVGVRLDTLRARVQYQQRQQEVVAARSQTTKDTIQLLRVMGLPAGQSLELTDTAPYAELANMDLEAAKATAYVHRKDLLGVQQQIVLAVYEQRAVRYQRLPTLAVNGYYGIIGLTQGPYHGNFVAEATLAFPIFREASQRGEEEVVSAQITALRQQEASLRADVDAQIRAAMLDVTAAGELVKVARSSVELAQQELSDERDRFTAGVDDDLPVVDAEASVASAQAQLVQSLYQFNVAKLSLARATGVVETRYRSYLQP